MDELPEIILIDKPKGITSFDVIRHLRKSYSDSHNGDKAPKMGHAGTLDPLATGLMILGLGKGTKKLSNLIKLDKEYEAEVLLGERRTTGDMEGRVIEEKEVIETVEILRSKISPVLQSMIGEMELPVSAYSAIKVGGVPMYKKARKAEKSGGVINELPLRTMRVDEIELEKVFYVEKKVIVTIRFVVSSGTYIRSLAEEFGKRLGYPATLKNLRRTKVGKFNIEDAVEIEDAFLNLK